MKGWDKKAVQAAEARMAGRGQPQITLYDGHPSLTKKKPTMKSTQSESQMQQAVIKWWAIACKQYELDERLLMAFPLQGARTARNGARLKAEGMRAGTPDLFLAVPRVHRHGLWIEMKKPGGKTTETQDFMHESLQSQLYATQVCFSTDDASVCIQQYLGKNVI